MKWSSSWAPDSAAGGGAQQVPAMGEYKQQQSGGGGAKKISHSHTHIQTYREMPPRSFRCARSTGVYIISIWRPFRRQRVASRRNGHLKDMPTVPAALAGAPPLQPPPHLSLTGAGDEKRNNIKICVYVLLYFLSFSFLLFALAIVVVAVAKGEWSGCMRDGVGAWHLPTFDTYL